MSRIMRKLAFCVCESKDPDQLLKFQASYHLLWLVVQLDLCLTWSETPKTGFAATRLKFIEN